MDRKTNLRIKSLALLLGCVLNAPVARAYATFGTCDGVPQRQESSSITYRPSSFSFPSGTAQRTALERVRSAWNTAPGNEYRIYFSYSNATSWKSGDGVNTVGLTPAYDWGTALAVTIRRYEPCIWPYFDGTSGEIEETDILFNPAYSWNLSTNPTLSSMDLKVSTTRSLVVVGVHEFGHSLGLAHENDVLATMNSYYPNGGLLGTTRPDPHADDVNGARKIYGTSGTARDLAVSSFRRTGVGTSELIPTPTSVTRGTSVPIRFTVSNRGTLQETVTVRFYASLDSVVSTTDPYLGSRTYSLSPGQETTTAPSLTIPTTLAAGSYYLGFIADPSNSAAEMDENNNRGRYATKTNVQ